MKSFTFIVKVKSLIQKFKSVSQDHEDVVILGYLQGDHIFEKQFLYFNLSSQNCITMKLLFILLTIKNFILMHILKINIHHF